MSASKEISTACGPPPPAAVYADLFYWNCCYSWDAKCNGYALFKRDGKLKRIVYACDRCNKLEAKAKKPDLHNSKKRAGIRSKKCGC